MNIFKYLSRRLSRAVLHRLQLDANLFRQNKLKLTTAIARGEILIDDMPGIDLKMVIDPAMYFKVGYTSYIFEPDSLDFIRDHFQQGQTFLDVGANVGYFSLFCSKIGGSHSRIIAFEPGDFACRLLQKNKAINGFDQLEIVQAGLGERNEEVLFNSGKPGMEVYNSLGAIVHPSADPDQFHQISIPLFKGTTWLDEHHVNHIDLMKLDVEGGEYFVLKGMLEMFQSQKIARLLIEITTEMSHAFGYEPNDIISLLRECGYAWFCLGSCGRLKPLRSNDISKAPEGGHMFVALSPRASRQIAGRH
ncbi:MAG: FkbM family methyltransferase [Cyanobacteriota bacterium]